MCTDFEKRIYNEYLKESRGAKSLPYRNRKDFTKLDPTIKLCLQKLSYLFNKHQEINITDFFKAPYFVYPEGETTQLKFYTTQKAISIYKIYINSKKSFDDSKNSDNISTTSKTTEDQLN
jgi:hypothetical protein